MNVLQTTNLSKTYYSNKGTISYQALSDFDLSVAKGEFVGIMGPSGSGKTTLLNLLATIDKPTQGEMMINGIQPKTLKDQDLALFRRRELGFVFQDFNLLDTLTIRENILLPLALDKVKLREMEARLDELADALQIKHILDHRTYEVSGGQQQRAACARAIIHNPALILADEPTGNLDSKSAKQVMNTLAQLNEEKEATILLVTHDATAASFCKRIVFIKDGRFFSEIHRGTNRQVFYQSILDTLSVLGGDFHEFENHRP
ncbi:MULTISPECIES: lantibiotic ABC transporter ATP-binding protein PsdA [Bacillus]|uniref:Lantibiotic ABC transporter ATP-binding protein PsdA n=1 Tax=Bacillus inaquosorum TaxID=483913 RepID=A0A9Q4HSK1_9BACI|nr:MULTISPECIES: lantibiotic ABC transporter ATP-binding protein PsdA [Bacillus]MCY7751339.1 lantibiotic ABC transporter ATP-binding protein PsdA [Bacillus inaquosorum]MCY7759340.1 lantibiotic ABC transporter ATP-binding protein PsdA [Bacillus inaquosorum]MCY7765220.1 lantibiotic ABC transporter ATP-binding protein PsdA [Bacillus inaquosorum]MCY7786314.1 lantibiotic ABC transporter ATP-binding protein PsdA [Bacillus inaquosorum]MCY7818893.1 lantibiotic ABC transporter ATP-binding protein PsdA 